MCLCTLVGCSMRDDSSRISDLAAFEILLIRPLTLLDTKPLPASLITAQNKEGILPVATLM